MTVVDHHREDRSALAAVLDGCPTGVLIVERDGRLVQANASVRDLLGLDANRLLVAYTSDYLDLSEPLDALVGSSDPSHRETKLVKRVLRADGASLWIEFQLVALQAGATRGLVAVYLTDRTRQHLQERTIRAQVAGLDLALSQADVAVVVTDGATRTLRWSPGAEQLFGVADDQATGAELATLIGAKQTEIEALLDQAYRGQVVRGVSLAADRHGATSMLSVSVALAASDEFASRDRTSVDAARVAWVLLPSSAAPSIPSLRASERRLRKILQNINDTVTVIDEEGRTISSSGQFSTKPILGYPAEAWSNGLNIFDLVHPDDQALVGERLVHILEHPGQRITGKMRVRAESGDYVDAEGWAVNLLHDPDVAGILLTTRNVSERTRHEAFVTDQAEILRQIASAAPLENTMRRLLELVNTNVNGCVSAFIYTDGVSVPTRTYTTLPISDDQLEALAAATAPRPAGGPVVVQDIDTLSSSPALAAALRQSGHRTAVAVPVASPASSGSGNVGPGSGLLICLFGEARTPTPREWEVLRSTADLAAIAIEREHSERNLAHQALHDDLTGLANRHLLVDRLEQALNRAKRRQRHLALMFLDLDRFKTVNDSFGHHIGDQLLSQFADRLRLLVRPEDTVARFGGDEFVVLVEHVVDESDATQIADRLEGAMSEPFVLDGRPLAVTVSVGIVIGSGEDTPEALLRNADTAMYRAKELGRNRTEIYDGRLEAHLADRAQLSLDLRTALSEGHLRLEYQPVVRVASGELAMVEASLRWDHPQRGRLSPSDFLAIAEDSGQGLELGAWTLERGLADLAAFARDPAWIAAPSWPRPPRLSISLTGRQLAHPDLVTRVAAALQRQHFEPAHLAIGIPERTVAAAGEQALRNITELHELGVAIALDDLGGAHGTALLGVLKRAPVTLVRIDPSVIAGLHGNRTLNGSLPLPAQHSMAAGLLGLGHGLGLQVAAKGVDNDAQFRQIAALGYDLAQGRAVGDPVDADGMVSLLPS